MRRRNFIEKSAIVTGSAVLLPNIALSLSGHSPLHCTDHIRHGYYGSDAGYNFIGNGCVERLRIDRFRNPHGDMLLVEILHGNTRIHLARLEESILIRTSESSKEIDLNDLTYSIIDEEYGIAIARPGCLHRSREEKSVVVIGQAGEEVRVMQASAIDPADEVVLLYLV